eukprot:scaffold9629_cov72-Phaeocystis_antarctica.AAC.1
MVVHMPTSVPSSRLKKAYLMRRVGARVSVRVGVGVRMRGGGPGCVHDMYRVRGARHDNTDVDEQVAEQREHQEQERGVERARHEARPLLELVRRVVPVVPRYAVRTARPRLVRVRRTYSAWHLGASWPAPPVRTARRRLVSVARTYRTEAPGRTCKLSVAPEAEQRRVVKVFPVPEWSTAVKSAALEAARSSTRGSGWAPSGSASVWECRAAWSRQARPGEALEPSWGIAKRASLTVLQFCEAMPVWDVGMADAIVRVKVAPACEHEVEPAITASSLGSPGI